MQARRLLAVALAFAAALAVFSATRGDERAAAGPRPAGADVLAEAAGTAAGRHDFRRALRLARRARALAPNALVAYPVLVDALVELGRYREAERTLQRFVDLRPGVPAYARVSYFRELHGDLRGAAGALRMAVAAAGPAREHAAYLQSLLGSVELSRGRLDAARGAFAAALASMPGYPAATAGRARIAAASGDLRGAIARWRRLVARHPLPEYAIALGETELAAGRPSAGRRDLALVRAQERLLAATGVNADVELAIFEADHGDRARGVALARAAWAQAPSVRSADALGWALTRAGRPRAGLRWAGRALRLGSLDPSFRYHAGLAAMAVGRAAEGARNLRMALRHGLEAYPLHANRARAALEAR